MVSKEYLINEAIEASKNSYSPYSKISVGCALLCENGKIYKGTNIENSSFGATICAERVAVFKAVSEGERLFCAIAITHSPCGICRQVLSEFAPNIKVYIKNGENIDEYILSELMPNAFKIT